MDAAPTSIDDLLSRATAADASDLHHVAGAPPSVRVRGNLTPMDLYLGDIDVRIRGPHPGRDKHPCDYAVELIG